MLQVVHEVMEPGRKLRQPLLFEEVQGQQHEPGKDYFHGVSIMAASIHPQVILSKAKNLEVGAESTCVSALGAQRPIGLT